MKHLFYLAVVSITLFSCEKDDSDIVNSKELQQSEHQAYEEDRITASISYYNNDEEVMDDVIIDSLSKNDRAEGIDRAAIAPIDPK